MQARLRSRFGTDDPLRRSCVSKARNAGEIAFWIWPAQPSAEIVRVEGAKCRWEHENYAWKVVCSKNSCSYIDFEAPRAGKIFTFLGMSRVKRSFWKSIFSLFGNVSCETLVLEVQILTFCECLVWNARFGSFDSPFFGMSRVKRSFWKFEFSFLGNVSCETLVLEVYFLTFWECLVWNARFGSSNSHFLRMSRVKRSFWKLWFSLFRNVSRETLVLEVWIFIFGECLVWNARFGSLFSHFLGMSRVKRSFWKFKFSLFANVSCETLVLEVWIFIFGECLVWNARFGSLFSHFLGMSRVKRSFWKSKVSLFANVSCETLVLEVYILTFCECLVPNARFGSPNSHFLRMSRVKRSFWKSKFSFFGNVSCETLVL